MSKHTSKQTVNIGTIPKKPKGKNLEGKEAKYDLVVMTKCMDKLSKDKVKQ